MADDYEMRRIFGQSLAFLVVPFGTCVVNRYRSYNIHYLLLYGASLASEGPTFFTKM